MKHRHSIEKCSMCQGIISQCRCMEPKGWAICNECKDRQPHPTAPPSECGTCRFDMTAENLGCSLGNDQKTLRENYPNEKCEEYEPAPSGPPVEPGVFDLTVRLEVYKVDISGAYRECPPDVRLFAMFNGHEIEISEIKGRWSEPKEPS